MKANELRIGNLVYSQTEVENGNHLPVIVIGIDTKHITYLSQNHRIHSEIRPFQVMPIQLYPIPLTKIWLDKFGFKDSLILLPENGELEIRLFSSTFHIWTTKEQVAIPIYRNQINYIHQLQNLYFALTGVELAL
ncbi:hypothetical protein QG516_03685 [Pedobacter gandavensis]|uniref:hypothetical protein n=1 Tax=Pedobacter gandavensis TaxID=2679963 RepID=UPI002478C379|nr:hypothetical protein [Pedobacter gandavensis]WGQ10755.1 hypothetical protein QG516_03685 [Pedobacter gandavensis]